MDASEEAFEPPVIANSIGSDPNGPPIPGQEPPKALMVPQQEAPSSTRPSTQQIFAKARAAAQAEITELKEKQAKEIEALRKQYENTKHSSSSVSDKAHEDEIKALKAAYEKQISDLNNQHLTASGSNMVTLQNFKSNSNKLNRSSSKHLQICKAGKKHIMNFNRTTKASRNRFKNNLMRLK